MPTYDARCKTCGHTQEYYEKIQNHSNTPSCEKCGSAMEQIVVFSSPNVQTFEPYWDPHIGTGGPIYVESKKQKKRLLKENGLREKCDYFS